MLARQRGLAGHIMGENTGGGGAGAIGRLTGALRAGYHGIFYLDYPALVAGRGSLDGALMSDYHGVLASSGKNGSPPNRG
jgi:hypothetical protein